MDHLREMLIEALRQPTVHTTGLVSVRATDELRAEERRTKALASIGQLLGREISDDDVHMASADVCNNVIDSYDSRLAESSLRQMSKLMPRSQFSVGHDMGGWSYARTFEARIREPQDGARSVPINSKGLRELRDLKHASWVEEDHYWPKRVSWAADLDERHRYGLASEVSAHWAFDTAICSVCVDDLRKCDHFPGDDYEGKKSWYEMRDVTDYIETGFVIKGGQYGTATYPLGDGRSIMPFSVAIREVKSSKRTWDAWRAEISDVLKATEARQSRRSRFTREGEDGLADARDFFAKGLKRAVSV